MPSFWTKPLKRPIRRVMVVLSYLLFAFSMTLLLTIKPEELLVVVPFFSASFLLAMRLNRHTSLIASRWGDAVDERERTVRNQAHTLGYQVVMGIVMVLMIVFFGLHIFETLYTPNVLLGALFMMCFLFFVTVPATMVAWLEPDPIDDAADSASKREMT